MAEAVDDFISQTEALRQTFKAMQGWGDVNIPSDARALQPISQQLAYICGQLLQEVRMAHNFKIDLTLKKTDGLVSADVKLSILRLAKPQPVTQS